MRLKGAYLVLVGILFLHSISVEAVIKEHSPAAPTTVRIAVLAFKPKPQVLAQWKPIADYLEKSIHRPVSLSVLDYKEMNDVVTRQQVDVVVTNPGHYVLLNHRGLVQSPLVTLINQVGPFELQSFGGVIFTRPDSAISSLEDISNNKIAAVSTDSLGGYQMQAYELLKVGNDIGSKPSLLVKTGMPHSKVIESVLNGEAEVGFVRDSVLEGLINDGKLNSNQFKIINKQVSNNSPYLVSTKLYPEWPVTVTMKVDEHFSRSLTIALLSLEPNHHAAVAAKIHGFTSPAVYEGVEDVLRELRMPPFDVTPQFTLKDFWNRHFIVLSTLITVLLLLGTTLLSLLYLQTRRVHQSLSRFATLFELSPEPIWLLKEGVFVDCNTVAVTLLGFQDKKEVLGKGPLDLSPEYQLGGISSKTVAEDKIRNAQKETQRFDWIHSTPTGENIVVKINLAPIRLDGTNMLLSVGHDVTDLVKNQEQQSLASSVFTHAKEGILITDPSGTILNVNDTLVATSGYGRDELIGNNPRILQSGKQAKEYYSEMWNSIATYGYWTGEIVNKRKDGLEYPGILTISSVRDGDNKITNYVGHFTDITHLKDQESKLRELAHFDPLTKLPNRNLKALRLNQAISQCRRNKHSLAVAFIDLDGFKEINDKYGHSVGDELLIAISQNMSGALRTGDTLARLGGDEFVAILTELEKVEDADVILRRILVSASAEVATSVGQLHLSASIGVTIFPQDASDADQLIRHADIAMYQAKLAGKNRFHYFDVGQDQSAQARMTVLSQVEEALSLNQFVLYYQPKVNMRTGKIVGVEALIRWLHPERGLIPPMEFLPYLENHTVELEVGDWVISEAFRQCSAWKKIGLNMKISINISANQLQSSSFVHDLSTHLNQNPDVLPSNIELEILESAALSDIKRTSSILKEFEALGIGFALDDFGTGYSSLSYLRQLPAELIKIDQSFVRDMLEDSDDLAIVEGVVGLATSFRRKVIAEGVETLAHGNALLSLGCELAQGYVISRPKPAREFEEWLSEWRAPDTWVSYSRGKCDATVTFAEVGHRSWVSRISGYLEGAFDTPPPMSSTDCHLGRWLLDEGEASFGHMQEFAELITLHEKVHALGRELVKNNAELDEAELATKFDELSELRERVLTKLRALCHPPA